MTVSNSATSVFLLTLVMNGPCFGIPQTYLAHIKRASEFRGHLDGLRNSWESYTFQLVREYSDFILVVSVYNRSLRSSGIYLCRASLLCCYREYDCAHLNDQGVEEETGLPWVCSLSTMSEL